MTENPERTAARSRSNAHIAFQQLARDDRSGAAPHGDRALGDADSALDPRDACLVRLGALTAMNAPQASVQRLVSEMTLAGLTDRQVVLCILDLVPLVGRPRVAAISEQLAQALGYDVLAVDDDRGSGDLD